MGCITSQTAVNDHSDRARVLTAATALWHTEHPSTLRQVDLARADFAAIADDLDLLKAQLARIPTRKELARIALGVIFGAAGLVIGWLELFSRHCVS